MHIEAVETSRRVQAARINGARSRGPRTAEGKARSSQNARKHGLRAAAPGQAERAELEALVGELEGQYRPRSAFARELVAQAAHALLRISQADRLEAGLLSGGIESEDGPIRGADLLLDPEGRQALSLLLRYRGAAERQLQRALRMLAAAPIGEPAGLQGPGDALSALEAVLMRPVPRSAERTERTQAPPNRHERRRIKALERRMA